MTQKSAETSSWRRKVLFAIVISMLHAVHNNGVRDVSAVGCI